MQNPYGASTIQCFPLDDRVKSSHWHPTGGETSTMTTTNDDKRTIIEGVAHRYVVVAHLGAGSMGSTKKVFDFKSGPMKKFAVKIMQPELACKDARAKQHFVHEARATMALGHPNVVTVHYLDELLDGTPLYAMELLNGKSVAQLIKDMGRIHPVVALNLIVDMLDGLHEAHKHSLIHQDVKPSNIMTHTEKKHGLMAKAVDFGVCRTLDDCDGGFAGTFAYAAPEQARGKDIGPWTDVFGAGATLFEMLTGERPFLAYRNTLSDLLARSDKRPPSILDFGPFDRELAEVVAAMLSPLPSERPTAKILTSTLRAIVCKLGPGPKVDKTSQVGAPILRALLEDTTEPTALASRELRERQIGMPEPLSVGGSTTIEAPPPIDATAPSPAGVAMRVAVGAESAAVMVNAGRARPRSQDGRPVGESMKPPSLRRPKRVEPAPISELPTEPPSQFVAAPPNVRPVYVDRPLENGHPHREANVYRAAPSYPPPGKGRTVPMAPAYVSRPMPPVVYVPSPASPKYSRLEIKLRRFYQAKIARHLAADRVERVVLSVAAAIILATSVLVGLRLRTRRWLWQTPPTAAPSSIASLTVPAASAPPIASPPAAVSSGLPLPAAAVLPATIASASSSGEKTVPSAPAHHRRDRRPEAASAASSRREPHPVAPPATTKATSTARRSTPELVPQRLDDGYVDFDGQMRSAPRHPTPTTAPPTAEPSRDIGSFQ